MRTLLKPIAFAVFAIAFMAARPGNEYLLLLNLNGEEVRWVMADGGVSGMYGSGQQCMPVAQLPAACNSTIEVVPTAPINLCERSTSVGQGWDGGCNTIVGDMNFGIPLQPYVSKFIVLRSQTTHLCQAGDAGSVVTPVFGLQ